MAGLMAGNPARAVPTLLWCAFALLVGLVGVLAGRGFASEEKEPAAAQPVVYEVVQGSVEHVLRYEAKGSWPQVPLVWAAAGGVVTSVDLPSDGALTAGSQILSIGLRPVVAMDGKVPASRDLALGVSGADVRQLQGFLAKAGYPVEPDGKFGATTRRAVLAWQKKAGFAADGVVRFGDVFFTKLPARASIAAGVGVGMMVDAGAPLVEGVAGDAVTEFEVSAELAAMIPRTGAVTVSLGDDAWEGQFGTPWVDGDGLLTHIPVLSPSGGPVCGADCGNALPLGRVSTLSVTVVEVPLTSGPVVPVSALRTEPSAQATVLGADGETVPVNVVASYGGLAVVEGVDVGDKILVFGGG
ncbi:MAG: peptidoglycan-binding protein [Propionibacteriaceae bacterium]|jgi:peptidoglycan hydrolase-like protein with peptidoglycan-binding domain|nr:peptidoglycan-binding protein [Propionibacteriaceae bacterium]